MLKEDLKKQIKAFASGRAELVKIEQDKCPHLQGSHPLSCSPSYLTSIVWHDDIGICTNCLKMFMPGDEGYIEWRTKRSGNRMSTSYRTVEVVEITDEIKKEINTQFCPFDVGYPENGQF